MPDKDAQTILMRAAHGVLCSEDHYKGRPVDSVIDVALDAITDLEMEIKRLNYLLRQKDKNR